MGVSENRGVSPKMDGENDGKPLLIHGWFGGYHYYFWKPPHQRNESLRNSLWAWPPGKTATLSESCCFFPTIKGCPVQVQTPGRNGMEFSEWAAVVMNHHFSDFCFCWVIFSNCVFFPHGIHKSTLNWKPQHVGGPESVLISSCNFLKNHQSQAKQSRVVDELAETFLPFSRGAFQLIFFVVPWHQPRFTPAAEINHRFSASFGEILVTVWGVGIMWMLEKVMGDIHPE